MIQQFINYFVSAAWYWQVGMLAMTIASAAVITMMGIRVYKSNKGE